MAREHPDNAQTLLRRLLGLQEISPLDGPADFKDYYFGVVQGNIFPRFSQLAELVAKKGMDISRANSPETYFYETTSGKMTDPDYLSMYITTSTQTKPLIINGEIVGNEAAFISLFNGSVQVSFRLMDDGNVAFVSESSEGGQRLLNSSSAFFDEVESSKLFPTANAAAWIDKVVQKHILQQAQTELVALPVLR